MILSVLSYIAQLEDNAVPVKVNANVSRRDYYILGAILAIYLVIALGYGIVNPLFEAPDEHFHAFTALEISETRELPSVQADFDPWLGAEPAQPPMYYVMAATILEMFDMTGAREQTWFNPRAQLGDASSPQNINAFVHAPIEDWPWQGHVLGFHVLRVLSTITGLGTLLCIFGCARLLWPSAPKRALLAVGLVAFLPQYGFLHASVSNDPLIILLSSLTLFQLLRMWYLGVETKRLLAAGVLTGLAILTKTAGLLLLAYALLFVVIIAWRDFRESGMRSVVEKGVSSAFLVAIPALVLGGWVLWRNWSIYQDITATSPIIQIYGGDRGFSVFDVLGETSGLWSSMLAVFGWFNVVAPQWVYSVWNLIVLLSLIGIIISAVLHWSSKGVSREKNIAGRLLSFLARLVSRPAGDRWPGIPALLLGLWVLLVYAGLVVFSLQIHASQGRLLFPAILPLALGAAYGLSRFRWKGISIIALLAALSTTLYCLLVVIPNAYAKPETISVGEIPSDFIALNQDLGQGLELLGYQIDTPGVSAEELVLLTLYWKAEEVRTQGEIQDAPEYVIELFGRDDQLAGKVQGFHGGGLFPSTLWQPGEVVVDRLGVKLEEDVLAPVQARAIVKLAGETASSGIGSLKITPAIWPDPSGDVLAAINGIEITEAYIEKSVVSAGDELLANVRWQVQSPADRNLTTFVHLGDPSREPLAQGDRPPLGGHYPTSMWESGEVIEDIYYIPLPVDLARGEYPVFMGLYDPASGIRLPLYVDGVRQPNDALLIERVTIE